MTCEFLINGWLCDNKEAMTKDGGGEGKVDTGWEEKEGSSPWKGRATQTWRKVGRAVKQPQPAQDQLPPSPTLFSWTGTGPGGGARVRNGTLRQPPPLPEAAGTGWSRLEQAEPAREPTTHKGSRRLTTSISLREAGVGWGVRVRWHSCRAPPPHFLKGLRPRRPGNTPLPRPGGPRVLEAQRPRRGVPSPLGLSSAFSRRDLFSCVEAGVREVPPNPEDF